MRRRASEIIRNLETRIARLEKQSKKFPSKAVDLNKVTNSDGFWNMTLSDLKAINPVLSTRGLKNPNAEMSDIIFFLNMAAGAWENTQKGSKTSSLEKQSGRLYTVTVRHNNSNGYDIVGDYAYDNNGEVVASGNDGRSLDYSEVHFRNEDDGRIFIQDITNLGLKVQGDLSYVR